MKDDIISSLLKEELSPVLPECERKVMEFCLICTSKEQFLDVENNQIKNTLFCSKIMVELQRIITIKTSMGGPVAIS